MTTAAYIADSKRQFPNLLGLYNLCPTPEQITYADHSETWCYDWAFTTCKKSLTSGCAPGTGCGSLFHFHHHCEIGHFRFVSFISISHSHHPLFAKLCQMTNADKGMMPLHVGIDPADTRIRSIRKSDSNPGSFLLQVSAKWSSSEEVGLCCLRVSECILLESGLGLVNSEIMFWTNIWTRGFNLQLLLTLLKPCKDTIAVWRITDVYITWHHLQQPQQCV